MAATLQFDAKRLAHFVALFDSNSDGEAHSALLRAREALKKSRCRFVDVIETDAYRNAIAQAVKPQFRRTGTVRADDRELENLRKDKAYLADRLTAEEIASDDLRARVQELEAMNRKLRAVNDEYTNHLQRLQEEFQNYRRRVMAAKDNPRGQ